MNQQQFDKQIADKLAEQQFVPKEQGWLALQSQMAANQPPQIIDENPTPAAPFFKWKRVAAILLPLLALWGVWAITNYSKPSSSIASQTSTTTNANGILQTDTTAAPLVVNDSVAEKAIIDYLAKEPISETTEVTSLSSKTIANAFNKSYKSPMLNTQHNISVAATNSASNNNSTINNSTIINNNTIANNTIANTPNNTTPVTKQNTIIADVEKATTTTTTAIAKQDPTATPKQKLGLDISMPNPTKPIDKRTGISVLAGMQTNTQTYYSNAINLGIAAQKNISKRLYVDASVSVSSNNPSWLQSNIVSSTELRNSMALAKNGNSIAGLDAPTDFTNAYGVNPSTNTFRVNGNTIPISELTDDVAITDAAVHRLASNQIEFAPMVGYHFSKKIRLAGGVDAARIINSKGYKNSVELLMLQAQNVPAMRNWDMGALAKIEYAITKKINVGYRHRQGLVNVANNIATRRSYNGVIVKYQFR
jgi:hypothetical protein